MKIRSLLLLVFAVWAPHYFAQYTFEGINFDFKAYQLEDLMFGQTEDELKKNLEKDVLPLAKSIVKIENRGKTGYGVHLGGDKILTMLDLADGGEVRYQGALDGELQTATHFYVADPLHNLIILKTNKRAQIRGTLPDAPAYLTSFGVMHLAKNTFLYEKLPGIEERPERRNTRLFEANEWVELPYKGKNNIHRALLFQNSLSSISVGTAIAAKKGNSYYVVPNLYARVLNNLSAQPVREIGTLSAVAADTKISGKSDGVYEVDLIQTVPFTKKNNYAEYRIDYFERKGGDLSFFITYSQIDRGSKKVFDPNYVLLDKETNAVYYPEYERLPSNTVYHNSSYTAKFTFKKVPAEVNKVELIGLTDKGQVAVDKPLERQDPQLPSIILSNYPKASRPKYNLKKLESGEEGTVSFYMLKEKSNNTGKPLIAVNRKEVGTIDYYLRPEHNLSETEFCGNSASLSVRLKEGEYKYQAVDGSKKTERKFKVEKGKCTNVLVSF